MQGRMVLKITGILMIIAAAFSILAGIFVGGLGALAAGVGAASGLTGAYWAALFLTLVGGICQLVAGIQGVRYSQSPESARPLILWGVIVALFNILGAALNTVNSGEVSLTPILTSVAVPVLYIFGAAQSGKSDNT